MTQSRMLIPVRGSRVRQSFSSDVLQEHLKVFREQVSMHVPRNSGVTFVPAKCIGRCLPNLVVTRAYSRCGMFNDRFDFC
jgi:hypothetical protein